MPDNLMFDVYDDRWRDCWVAATSVTRLRKKQVDIDICQRVSRLLEDYGPESDRPLTLRIYGTMIKGFCVINNDRARSLYGDCERLVLMFARKPFGEGDNSIKLPAAKRPRMEAALTLDLDLARVEANEAFDWTQAPLEAGALLRLGGAQLLDEEALPSLELPAGNMCGLLEAAPLIGGDAAMQDSGWLPRVCGSFDEAPLISAPPDPLMSQIVAMEEVNARQPVEPPFGAEKLPEPAAEHQPMADPVAMPESAAPPDSLAVAQQRRRRDFDIKPGVVYGFDTEPMLAAREYERWQSDDAELVRARVKPNEYAEQMASVPDVAEHWGSRLRLLIDPVDKASVLGMASAAEQPGTAVPEGNFVAEPPEIQAMLAAGGDALNAFSSQPPEFGFPGDVPGMPVAEHAGVLAELAQASTGCETMGARAEVQDDRTHEVGEILHGCLRKHGMSTVNFSDLMPPTVAVRPTAACTFSALLALASAGEFNVEQATPYGPIAISEVNT